MSRILIVDQDSKRCMTLGRALLRMGHSTAFAFNGARAIECLSADGTDLVILDVMMLSMDGWQVLNWIRSRAGNSDMPVIVYGSSVDLRLRSLVSELGIDDFLSATSCYEELHAAIEKHARSPLKRVA
jgi:two-component system copper resistance phosphate regulon response regulator CusR